MVYSRPKTSKEQSNDEVNLIEQHIDTDQIEDDQNTEKDKKRERTEYYNLLNLFISGTGSHSGI